MIEDIMWRPTATLENIKARSALYQQIRAFFNERNVVEVETPTLVSSGVSEPHIANIEVTSEHSSGYLNTSMYLQSSPEYAMKRLLAAGMGDCFQLSKVFRNDELSSRHNVEFSMLEWYRIGMTDQDLMLELESLMQLFFPEAEPVYLSYQEAILQFANLDPLNTQAGEIEHVLAQHGIDYDVVHGNKAALLDLLMACVIEPSFNKDRLTFVHSFPREQAALAKICEHDRRLAHRFELYFGGLELANGYWELQNAQEQRVRFEVDNQKREALGFQNIAIDEKFMSALKCGLPNCAGVALGLDRVLMLAVGAQSIRDVLTFPTDLA